MDEMIEQSGAKRNRIHELMRQLSKRNMSAYEALYREFREDVYKFAMSAVGQAQAAEDITQSVFEKLLDKKFKLPLLANGAAYFFRIAQNACNDYFRANKRFDKYILDVSVRQNYLQTHCTALSYEEMFAGLTNEEKQLVILRYEKHYLVKEIAKRTGISPRTLGRYYKEIRRKIRENLEGE